MKLEIDLKAVPDTWEFQNTIQSINQLFFYNLKKNKIKIVPGKRKIQSLLPQLLKNDQIYFTDHHCWNWRSI